MFQLKRDLGDSDIVDLSTDSIHPIRRRRNQNLLLSSRFHDDPDQQVDDFVRAHPEEDVFRAREVSDIGDFGFDRFVRRRRVPMQIELFDLVQLGPLCRFVGVDGVAKRVFVGVEEDTFGVIVPSATVGMQGKDIGSDYGLEVKVCWFFRVERFGEPVDRHFGWLDVDFERRNGVTRAKLSGREVSAKPTTRGRRRGGRTPSYRTRNILSVEVFVQERAVRRVPPVTESVRGQLANW